MRPSLLPPWLRFVQGVVDTEDLPLNVSREMLQSTPVLARIRKALTGRVLGELKARAKDEEDYAEFLGEFRPVLKEGVWEDSEHRADIAPLLRFRSSAEEGWTSLADYVARMQPGQAGHLLSWRATTPRPCAARRSSRDFARKGIEVLLLADPIDAFWPDRFDTLRAAIRSAA